MLNQPMKALLIHAGPRARQHIASHGLRPQDVRLVPAAAGGPKGLMLTHLDRHLFGRWLPMGGHTVHLVGASIGAWRMGAALMPDPVRALTALTEGYIAQHIEPEAGRRFPSSARITAGFTQTLQEFFGEATPSLLAHPRWRLHVLTAKGRHMLRHDTPARTALGLGAMALGNVLSRRAVGLFMERHVFSSPGEALPLRLRDLPTRYVALTPDNFLAAMRASCSIPFMLQGVPDIPGSQAGAHWDGGLVDYHVHWPYAALGEGLVLYPHFQRQVVPGWLDKSLPWRHRATPGLSNLIVLSPNPAWVQRLPGGKLPDRTDFKTLTLSERCDRWRSAVAASAQLADDWQAWLHRGCPASELQPL